MAFPLKLPYDDYNPIVDKISNLSCDLYANQSSRKLANLRDYPLRSSGARRLDLSFFYRHIAPLERKIKSFSLNSKPMSF